MTVEIAVSDQAPTDVESDAVIVSATSTNETFALSDQAAKVDGVLDGYLTEWLTDIGYKADVASIAIVPTHHRIPAKAVVVAGLGDVPTRSSIRRAAASAARRLSERAGVVSALHGSDTQMVAASVEGFMLGLHRSPTQKRDPKELKLSRIDVLGAGTSEIERGRIYAGATVLARDLVNEPASVLDPEAFAERARAVASDVGLECEIFDQDELTKRGFGGLLAVARGSTNPPRLIRLHHKPRGAKGKVALVGKGVTFDSGGLSLKDPRGMETMKTDMGGGAAVLAAMAALPQLEVPIEVTAYIPATENMPSGSAIRPGDVITHYGGRTTEVLNTDAEGRLILADALTFASEEHPQAVIDIATLTGSMTVALGNKMTGAFANDDDLWAEFSAAAAEAAEPVWRLPLVEDYAKSLDSTVADMKNIGTRYGGAIVAALFLREFVGDGIPWVHLDIAGTGRSENGSDDCPKGGTGVMTRTLLEWLERK
ncbi:MAG TPA: leucyl aminopeptidase, partial [Actinomycetota bacterium]|nr:leucyl aminopeptidase [Actinomycetota bacterium]